MKVKDPMPPVRMSSVGIEDTDSATSADIAQEIPGRSGNAPTGSEFADEVRRSDYAPGYREQRILYELLHGNMPAWYRNLVELEVRETIGGTPHIVVYRVMPDYLAIGSDDDYLRVSMTPLTAQVFADRYGFMLPTRKMSAQIHAAATVKLTPQAISPHNTSFDLFVEHNAIIQRQWEQSGASPGELVAGHKKDVVISTRIDNEPANVMIYGWHDKSGRPLQALSGAHHLWFTDYSQCYRMVHRLVEVDGQSMSLSELLAHPVLHALVSDEGPVRVPRYQGPPTNFAAYAFSEEEWVNESQLPQSQHGLSAWHSARLEIAKGTARHGSGSWETTGRNRGPLVEKYLVSVGLPPGEFWCGAFVGFHYLNAGFDGETFIAADWTPDAREQPRKQIFHSAYRLRLFFVSSEGNYVEFPGAGLTDEARKEWLDTHVATFAPMPGDVLLMHSARGPFTHVGMVGGYDPATYELVVYEGNASDRAGAFVYNLMLDDATKGFRHFGLIGRFGRSELFFKPAILPDRATPEPVRHVTVALV